jgi:hypothetical protein
MHNPIMPYIEVYQNNLISGWLRGEKTKRERIASFLYMYTLNMYIWMYTCTCSLYIIYHVQNLNNLNTHK